MALLMLVCACLGAMTEAAGDGSREVAEVAAAGKVIASGRPCDHN